MQKKKILIIEDEPDQVMVIQMRLEANGYAVISASDGESGLKKAREEHPDLILLDIILPKIDGYETCRLLKSGADTRRIPVIAISAAGGKDMEEKCFSCGVEICIRKPYDSAKMMEEVNRLLGRQ